MDFSKYNIGLGITGSFCMFSRARKEIQRLKSMGANVIPIFLCLIIIKYQTLLELNYHYKILELLK